MSDAFETAVKVRLVEALLANYHRHTDQHGIIVASCDTELFGHNHFLLPLAAADA
ncbi:MAG: hypothetical protein KGJ86_07870 [Chloroflexota bacterium]|nr:hypothetical protein [Chloroflexota bacterium]